jgi:hypothetical protein
MWRESLDLKAKHYGKVGEVVEDVVVIVEDADAVVAVV